MTTVVAGAYRQFALTTSVEPSLAVGETLLERSAGNPPGFDPGFGAPAAKLLSPASTFRDSVCFDVRL